MLRNRIINGLEDRISETQYGFRKKRSTAQPIFATRRSMDRAEAAGDPLFLIFLDWEKAFDKLDQEELVNAIRRMNVPQQILQEIEKIYQSPKFNIKDIEGICSGRNQKNRH